MASLLVNKFRRLVSFNIGMIEGEIMQTERLRDDLRRMSRQGPAARPMWCPNSAFILHAALPASGDIPPRKFSLAISIQPSLRIIRNLKFITAILAL
jgi:hypothetical protein